MQSYHDQPPAGDLDSAVNALRHAPVPHGPPRQLLAKTLAALTHASRHAHPQPNRWNLRQRLVAVAASLLIATTLLTAILLFTPNADHASAQVRSQIESARSLRFIARARNTLDHAARPLDISLTDSAMRIEAPGGPITIFDFHASKMLILYPRLHKAITADISDRAGLLTPTNFLAETKRVVANQPATLVPRDANGRLIEGFRFVNGKTIEDIWVDPDTNYPIEINVRGGDGLPLLSCTDIQFNPTLDPSLFSLAIPPGYTVVHSTFSPTLVAHWPTESDFIAGLRTAASLNNNTFPDHLQSFSSPTPEIASSPESLRAIEKIRIAAAFELMMSAQDDYRYTGAGIKLGDKSSPLCSWKQSSPQSRRTIYGDLHIANSSSPHP